LLFFPKTLILVKALGITCADVMSKFISIKERHPHPKYTQEIAQKVTDCTNKTVVALEQSECSAIQKDFQACLETGQRVHHKCAKQFKESLEVCTANHIGQLDA
jgi:hypothetical protein